MCLSAAFTFLKHVTDCYKSGVNIMMTLGAPRPLRLKFHTRRNNKVEETRTFEMWVIRLAENMLCATRSWRNVKFYYVYKFIDLQYQYGDSRNICLSFRF